MKKNRMDMFLCFALLTLFGCKENNVNKSPIVLGDSALIVTEKDTQYLQNFIEDIEPKRKKSSASQITQMMVQVDSLKNSKKIEEDEAGVSQKLSGFTINFEQCNVVFEGVSAHAINATQNERASNSVSYVMDVGNLLETKFEVSNLQDVHAEQRLFVKLAVRQGEETIMLNDLGKFTTQWYPLAGKNTRFISVGNNSLQFNNVDNAKIKNALDRELRKKKKSREEIQKWMSAIKQTNTYNDAPCVMLPSSAQWKITGKINGQSVRKLIQFDVP